MRFSKRPPPFDCTFQPQRNLQTVGQLNVLLLLFNSELVPLLFTSLPDQIAYFYSSQPLAKMQFAPGLNVDTFPESLSHWGSF